VRASDFVNAIDGCLTRVLGALDRAYFLYHIFRCASPSLLSMLCFYFFFPPRYTSDDVIAQSISMRCQMLHLLYKHVLQLSHIFQNRRTMGTLSL
jgi:hypothetical protein